MSVRVNCPVLVNCPVCDNCPVHDTKYYPEPENLMALHIVSRVPGRCYCEYAEVDQIEIFHNGGHFYMKNGHILTVFLVKMAAILEKRQISKNGK